MGKILPEKSLEAVDEMLEKGEIKSPASTQSSRILPAKTIHPHRQVGELVFRIEADGQVGIEAQIPQDPFYVRALAMACLSFVKELQQKGILMGPSVGLN